jgi:mannosyl-3-phosphoglycerate phosphatase
MTGSTDPTPLPRAKPCLLVLTDLDGTLLDADTYAFDGAKEALDALRARAIPLILASSKTRAEMEPIRQRLGLADPFIVENGGAVFLPKGYFPFPVPWAAVRGSFQVIELGIPCARLRAALKEIGQALGCRLIGFGDMSLDEVRALTGLAPQEALLAKQREYDEPFVIEDRPELADEVHRLAEARGLRCTRGGRFFHLTGDSDKGKACQTLIECYRQVASRQGQPLLTIAIGDDLNDLPMLALADRPVLVRKPDGSHVEAIRLPGLIRTTGIGPAGWNQAILGLLASV